MFHFAFYLMKAWCPYCQKVWLFLELKSIPYAVRKVPMNAYGNKPAWYTRQVDGGKLPAVEIDGELHTGSLDIMHVLEKTFPNHGPCMIPSTKREDDGSADSLMRRRFEELMSLEQQLQCDWFSLVFYPVEREALQSANQTFLNTLAIVDAALSNNGDSGGPWFLGGNAPSMVDLQHITQVERIIPSVLYWKGLFIRNTTVFPHLVVRL
jgi:glutathione S-transferase